MMSLRLPHPRSLAVALVVCLQILFFAPRPARAQSAAAVSGTVTDSSGAVLSGARVVLKNTATNVEQATVTNPSGYYAVANVLPGNYLLQVSRDGFALARETNIVLSVNQAATFNFALKPGSVQQSVTVSSEATEIQTSTAQLGAVIETKSVNNLPLNGRNFTELLELTPGVAPNGGLHAQTNGGGETAVPIGQYTFPAVNGQSSRSNTFFLDGANDLGSYNTTYNYEPVVDDIQEFKVQSHSDLAEYGQVTGGIVTVITKSGSNALHGSLWEFLRNSAFDARDYFLPKVNPLRQNQFGGTLGGPVIFPRLYNGRNKTFFFFTYEGFRRSEASQTLLTTPTTAQLGGDFSNLLAQGIVIYNPFSTRPDPAHPGRYLRDPFPNNQIPANLVSPASLLFAKYVYPNPNASGLAGGRNLIDATPALLSSGSYSGRIDQSFGQHDLLFGRVSEYNQPSNSSAANPYESDTDTVSGWNMTVHDVHTFGPTSDLEAYFGRNVGLNVIQSSLNHAPPGFAATLEQNGFSSAFIGGFSTASPYSSLPPSITVSGYISGGASYQAIANSNTYESGASFTKIWNRHNIKIGGVVATNNFNQLIASASETTSAFQTSNLETPTSASGAPTGDSLASFVLGIPTSAARRVTLEDEHNGWEDGVYAQDQMQVNPNLTINFGVRWDVNIWPVLNYLNSPGGQGYFGNMDLENGTYIITAQPPACSATVGAPCIPGGVLPANVVITPHSNHALHTTDYSNWQGRFGFAYHPLNKTAILGGYGRFYDEWADIVQESQSFAGTWPSNGLINSVTLNLTTPTATVQDPLSLGNGGAIPPSATPFTRESFYRNPNLVSPLSDQWNLGLQQGFGATTVLSVIYAGSRGSRNHLSGIKNTAEYPAPGTPAQVAGRRQYPYIIPTNYVDDTSNSNYNSLQTALQKGASNGLTYLISYTWSKSIDLACSGSNNTTCLLQDPYNPEADRSVSDFDLTHMFSGSVVYEAPFGVGRMYKSQSAIVNDVLGGWNVNGIVRMLSGSPYSVTVNGDIANTGNTFVQADRVGNPTPPHRSPSEWINTSAFQAPARYTFGTFGRNALRTDWYRDLDLSVFKLFPLPHEANLEFRAEAFNLTNTAVFGQPASVVGNPIFGSVAATANDPRELQLALKIEF